MEERGGGGDVLLFLAKSKAIICKLCKLKVLAGEKIPREISIREILLQIFVQLIYCCFSQDFRLFVVGNQNEFKPSK